MTAPFYSFLEAKQKIESFCAYQERCDQEIRQKLKSWFLHNEDIDILIADLIKNNFLNEERFAEAYAGGKFRIKKWGRVKIRQHLKQKNISDYSINKAFLQIDDESYHNTILDLITNKSKTIKYKNDWDKRIKLKNYLASKGFEIEIINNLLLDFK